MVYSTVVYATYNDRIGVLTLESSDRDILLNITGEPFRDSIRCEAVVDWHGSREEASIIFNSDKTGVFSYRSSYDSVNDIFINDAGIGERDELSVICKESSSVIVKKNMNDAMSLSCKDFNIELSVTDVEDYDEAATFFLLAGLTIIMRSYFKINNNSVIVDFIRSLK